MIELVLDRLWSVAPRATVDAKLAFVAWPAAFPRFDITTVLRAQHFLGQVLHESDGLRVMVENLNYRTPEQLMKTWPRRFPTIELAAAYVKSPEALAGLVYDHRADLGNVEAGDGWRYRGRGLIQITGRANYVEVGEELGVDIAAEPRLVIDPQHALAVACCIWKMRGCNEAADTDEVQKVTRRVNGGLTGIVSRRTWTGLARYVVREVPLAEVEET